MFKNTAGQSYRVFAFNRTTSEPVTGIAATITAKLSKDFGSLVATSDVNPTGDGGRILPVCVEPGGNQLR